MTHYTRCAREWKSSRRVFECNKTTVPDVLAECPDRSSQSSSSIYSFTPISKGQLPKFTWQGNGWRRGLDRHLLLHLALMLIICAEDC